MFDVIRLFNMSLCCHYHVYCFRFQEVFELLFQCHVEHICVVSTYCVVRYYYISAFSHTVGTRCNERRT